MFTPKQYRAKAAEYEELIRTTAIPDKAREFRRLEQSFTSLADNEEWLAGNFQHTVHAPDEDREGGASLAEEEEHILRCLGAAVIMHWNTLPRKLQRELFDYASSVGDLLRTTALRGQIARFLHKHKDDAL
jgi:hypothetical protein